MKIKIMKIKIMKIKIINVNKNGNKNGNNNNGNNNGNNKHHNHNKHHKHHHDGVMPLAFGEILYTSCDDYGPDELDSVNHNLKEWKVSGKMEDIEFNYSPLRVALDELQVPDLNSNSNNHVLAELKNAELDAVAGPPHSYNKNNDGVNSKIVVTMVWADWCGFSKKAKPEWDKVVKEMGNNNNIEFVDAEHKEKPEIAKKFKTKGFPTYYIEKDGKTTEFNGITEKDIKKNINKALNNN